MLFFVLLLSFFGLVQADGKLEIELVKYRHSASKDIKGRCCDSSLTFGCSNECDNYFIVCYRDYVPRTHRASDCLETRKTGLFADSFSFQVGKDLLGNSLDNPFKFNFNGAWDNSFSLKIDIWDMDIFSSDDSVDVLTANFANAAISSAWTSLTLKGKFSKRLVLKWRVQCRRNFYGDCSVLCVPHDSDSDGHYSCNRRTGERICTKGWSGNKCATAVCANCSRHGRCVKPNDCQCTLGWTGKSCEKCVPNQSCVNGFCVRGNDCVCYSSWIGQHCDRRARQDLTGCNESSCLNGGTCVIRRGNVSCSCLSDYNGSNCAIDANQCRSDPCLNGGTCRSHPNDYLCICPSGYTGKTCSQEIDECLINACLYGDCTNSINDFVCTCHPGFTGRHCATDVDECASDVNNCGSGMSCENTFGGHTCKCKLGYEETPDGLSCKPIQCDTLSYLSNTTTRVEFSSENREVNSTANITCVKGFFTNQTTPLRLVCLGDGLWDDDPEACEDIDECLVSSCLLDEVCYNTKGSYECRSRKRSGVNLTISPCSPGHCNQSQDHLNDDHVFDTSHGGSQSVGLYVGIALGLLVCFVIIVSAVIAFRRQVKQRSSRTFAPAASPVLDTVGGSSTSTSVCQRLAIESDNAVKRDAEPDYEVIPADANQYEDMTGLSKSNSKSRSADNACYASLNIQNAEGALAGERSVNRSNPIYGINTRTFEMKKIVS